jgi:hypothetical protein
MKKSLAIAIIGIIVLSGLGAGALSGDNETNDNSRKNLNTTYEDELDQSMTSTPDGVLPVGWYHPEENVTANLSVAQSFIPQKEVLTRIQFFMARNATTTIPCTLAIRDNLTGEDLASVRVNPTEFPVFDPDNWSTSLAWVEFNIDDIWVTSGQTYFIVISTTNVTNNYYIVSGNGTNIYPNGTAYYSFDDGKTWQEIPPGGGDGCFKTYGLEETFLQVTMIGGTFGPSFVIKNIGNYTAWDARWDITVKGGILGLIHKNFTGTLLELPPGNETIVKIGPIIGFGHITLSLRVSAANVHEISTEINALLFIFFWIIRA